MLKVVKDIVLAASRAFGYEIVPLRDLGQRELATHLNQLFAEFGIDCVLDVGANVGQYHDFLRNQVLYHGPIVSFEPVARNLEVLKQRARRDPSWTIEGYALGAEAGTQTINVTAETEFSSFLPPDYSKLPRVERFNTVDHAETVEVKTLDEVFLRLQDSLKFRRVYLKLDTQGYDIQVLRGGLRALPEICALQTEASLIGIYEGMPSYLDAIKFLGDHGFDVTGFFPVQRDRRLRLIECDCVTVNRAFAQIERDPVNAPKPRDGRVLVTAQL